MKRKAALVAVFMAVALLFSGCSFAGLDAHSLMHAPKPTGENEKDCVEVMWWLLKNPKARGIFNLGTGNARTWNDLVTAVFKASGVKPSIEYIDMPLEIRDQYQYVTEAKMDKLRRAGCPIKCRSLEDAITDYVTEHLQQADPYL